MVSAIKHQAEFFPINNGDASGGRHVGERFLQNIAIMENQYQGQTGPNMLGNYCWTIYRQADSSKNKQKATEIEFELL
jgi:hypothetical protein